MPAEIHDVRATSEEDGRPRLTCHSPECRGATLVRHPFHSDAQWDREAALFLAAHPPGPHSEEPPE